MAAAGWVCAVACALGLALLMPLKHVEPFVVRVDNTTGIVDVVPVYTAGAAPDEAVDALLPGSLSDGVRAVQLRHGRKRLRGMRRVPLRPAQPGVVCAMDRDQSGIPLSMCTRTAARCVSKSRRCRSSRAPAACRIWRKCDIFKALRQSGGNDEKLSHWVATVQYAYADPAKDPKTRRWNPLGFKIVEFKSEPEVMVETAADKEARHDP